MKNLLWLNVFLIGTAVAAAAIAQDKGDSVRLDLGGSGSEQTPGLQVRVVATGVGVDPEKALQNAFSHAIEQAVGVLVDAETVVRNDAVITEQILTFSRGYVEKYKVVREWEQDELHYVRIAAKVAAAKLAEKLKAHNVAAEEIDGRLMYLQVMHDVNAQADASEMLVDALSDYKEDRLLEAKILGKPEVAEKDDINATLRVKVGLRGDREAWAKVRQRITPVLAKAAFAHTRFASGQENEAVLRVSDPQRQQLYIAVMRSVSKSGGTVRWDMYAVATKLYYEIVGELAIQPFVLAVGLTDGEGRVCAEHEAQVPHSLYSAGGLALVGPFFYGIGYTNFTRTAVVAVDLVVKLEDLKRAEKCVAYIKNTDPMAEDVEEGAAEAELPK